MKTLDIPKGTQVLIGAPAKPMDQTQSAAIGEMLHSLPGVREAYLPHCFVPGVVESPAQILVLVLDNEAIEGRSG